MTEFFRSFILGGILVLGVSSGASAQSCAAGPVTVQILGSGGPAINSERASSSYLLWVDGHARMLVDMGGGAYLRFGQSVLPFTDQDGMTLALVGIADAENEPGWSNEDIPSEHAIRGLQGVTLLLESAQKTAAILTDVFGFREVAREGSVIRFAAAGNVKGSVVDIHEGARVPRHHQGRGSVHHIAFRVADDAQQAQMSEKLIRDHGRHPTEQKDRKYFRSIYFREPGGVLFEIATDIPGFSVDEPVEALGRDLELPNFLEPRRKEIERGLPVLENAAS